MSWFKVDDKVHAHPKFKRIPRALRLAASGLWMHAGAWAAQYETDGEVPSYILEDLLATDELIEALIAVELWDPAEDGIVFHDWSDFQPTREAQEKRRAAEAERVRKWRQDRARQKSHEKPVTSRNGNTVRTSSVREAYASPDPTRPDPTPTHSPAQEELLPKPPRKRGHVYPDAFELWWLSWPKKGDTKRDACKAWEKATKGTKTRPPRVSVQDVQVAVERYAADPNLPDNQFIPNASRWLNEDRWETGPLPPRGGRGPQAGDTHRAMERSHTAAQAYRALEDSGYYDQITPIDARRTA